MEWITIESSHDIPSISKKCANNAVIDWQSNDSLWKAMLTKILNNCNHLFVVIDFAYSITLWYFYVDIIQRDHP